MTTTKNILRRLAVLSFVLVLGITAVELRGGTPGITFATQGIELKIDSQAYYNGALVPGLTWTLKNLVPTADHFFNFLDVKPGDSGKTIISLHVSKSPAWMCLDFTNLKNKENGVNEPESQVDFSLDSGELAKGTYFFAWVDSHHDGKYTLGEKPLWEDGPKPASEVLNNKSYVIGDSKSGGECQVGQTRYVGVAWCVGTMTVNAQAGTITCNGAGLGNEAQTDSFTVDVGLRASPSRENPHFICGSPVTHEDKGQGDDLHNPLHDDHNGEPSTPDKSKTHE